MRPPLLPAGLVALLLVLPSVSAAAELRGRATVTDGDTIGVAGATET